MKHQWLYGLALAATLALGAAGQTDTPSTLGIAGVVVDVEGHPLGGALAEGYQYLAPSPIGPAEMDLKERVTTGTNGVFELRLPRTTTWLVVRKPGLGAVWRWIDPSSRASDERFVLQPATVLAGLVVDETDKPVADAEVWVSWASAEVVLEGDRRSYHHLQGKPARQCFSTRTAADGHFCLQDFPTNAIADLAVHAPNKVLPVPERDHIDFDNLRWGAGQRDIRLVLEPAGTIEGKVTAEATGQPLADARLLLLPRQRLVYSVESKPVYSGTDGTFRLGELAAGEYSLRAWVGTNTFPEWVAKTISVSVEAGRTNTGVQVPATKGGVLEIAVRMSGNRKPAADASFNVYSESYQMSGRLDSNGLAMIRLPSSEYHVSVYKEASRPERTTARIEDGQTNRIEIELRAAPTISGVVRDPQGNAAYGLSVLGLPGHFGSSAQGIKTDTNGHFELTWNPRSYGGPDTAYCLVALDPERNLAVAQDIDEDTTTVDLRLEPGLTAVGRVEDPDGRCITNATLNCFLWSGNMGSSFGEPATTDAAGRFEVKCLPAGQRYSINATAKGFGSAGQTLEEPEGETHRIEVPPFVLRIADHKISGRVVDDEEKPVARANVHLYGEGQPSTSVRTDEQGRFTLDQVCEGLARLSANFQNAYGNVSAEAGDTNVVIELGVRQSYERREPERPSLKGKPLPDLAVLGFAADAAPPGCSLLLCLFDAEQRPSRHTLRLLAQRHDTLQGKGLTLLAAQAAVIAAESVQSWKDDNPMPFPVGRVADKSAATKWVTDVEALPWLILTDPRGKVVAEGFALDELDAHLPALKE